MTRSSSRPCLIVDLPDSEIWDAAYLPALSEALGIEDVDDLLSLNLCNEWRKDRPVAGADLERIRHCPFVVADTSAGSARANFLLGYAVANRKRILHLRALDSPAGIEPLDIAARRYRSAADVREYLQRVVGYILAEVSTTEPARLEDFLIRCGLPLVVLEGDGQYGYALHRDGGERPIYISLSHGRYRPPEPWRSEFERVHHRQLDYAQSTGSVLFNGDLVRMLDFTPLRDERLGTRGIRIDCQPTDYFTFASSNHCWDFIGAEASQRLRQMESRDIGNLRQSVLANPLTVSVSLIIQDSRREWILIQHRNRDKNFHGKQDFVCAAAGMVSATRDVRSGEIDVYATACNELREETGVRVPEGHVVFLGLLRETSLREVGLVAEVVVEGDPETILAPRADLFESKGFELCEATPEAFARFLLRNRPIERFAPLGAGAITFSLLRRFSRERVESALRARA